MTPTTRSGVSSARFERGGHRYEEGNQEDDIGNCFTVSSRIAATVSIIMLLSSSATKPKRKYKARKKSPPGAAVEGLVQAGGLVVELDGAATGGVRYE